MNVAINKADYKILIVDDVYSNITLLKLLLTVEKYQIVTAMNGREAIERVLQDKPDLMLLDIMMPDMDGYEVTRQIRQLPAPYNDISIIFLTALNNTEAIVKGFQVGGNDYITKPFSKEELLSRVNHQISLEAAKRIILQQTEELRSIVQSRDKMYSVIAHDLRSPLGSIKMMLNMLLLNVTPEQIGKDMHELLTMANGAMEETFALLDNLLKWTKSQTGRLNVEPQKTDMVHLIQGTIDVFKKVAELKQIQLSVEAPATCCIYADVDMIKSILRNLLNNAIKFTRPGGKISVCVSDVPDEDGQIIVSVSDNGAGIPFEKQATLLKDSNRSTIGTNYEEGSGLGLLLVQDFVAKNGGKVWFESTEGEGTTFYFSIPSCPSRVEESPLIDQSDQPVNNT